MVNLCDLKTLVNKGKVYLMQKHLWCKKIWPSKVELYLEVNA